MDLYFGFPTCFDGINSLTKLDIDKNNVDFNFALFVYDWDGTTHMHSAPYQF